MQIKRVAVKAHIPAVLFEIIRRHLAGCAGMLLPEWDRAERDKLPVSLMEMFAWALDGWAALVFAAVWESSLCVSTKTTVAGV